MGGKWSSPLSAAETEEIARSKKSSRAAIDVAETNPLLLQNHTNEAPERVIQREKPGRENLDRPKRTKRAKEKKQLETRERKSKRKHLLRSQSMEE